MNRNSLLLGFGTILIIGLISFLFYLSSIHAYPWEEKSLKTYTVELYNCAEIASDTNEALTEEMKSILSASKSGSNNNEFVVPIAKIVLDSGKQEFKFGIPLLGFGLIRVQTAPSAYFFDDRLAQETEFWSSSAVEDQEYLNFRKEILKRHFTKEEALIDDKLKSSEWWQDTISEFIVNMGQSNPHIKKKSFNSYQELKKHLNVIFEAKAQALVGKTVKVYYLCGGSQIEPPCISDADGDGVCDEDDDCKNEAGPKENRGCKCKEGDQDGDGFCDEVDNCKTVRGVAPDGCPQPDRDNDGIPDAQDKCPNEIGLAPTGCPCKDRDRDGFCDNIDKCPDVYGKFKGCPADSDGDGVPDNLDKCIQIKGDLPNGCPTIRIKLKELASDLEANGYGAQGVLVEIPTYSNKNEASKFLTRLKFNFFNSGEEKVLEINGLSSHANEEKLAGIFNFKSSDHNFDLTVEVCWKESNVTLETQTFTHLTYVCDLNGTYKCGFKRNTAAIN